jgi:hypothetical protein
MASALMTAQPSLPNSAATVLLPEAIPPRIPMIGFFPGLLTIKQLTAHSHLTPSFYRKLGTMSRDSQNILQFGPGHLNRLWMAFSRSSGTLIPSFFAAFAWFQARSYRPSR